MALPLFTLKNISITLSGNRHLFSNVSFSVYPGEVILLLGHSGSGKSTLLKLLAGLLNTKRKGWSVKGQILTGNGNFDLNKGNPAIGGYIFQNYAVLDELSASQNIDIAKDHSQADLPVDNSVVTSLLKGISLNQSAHSLSGGQKQRVSIARTLYSGHPALLYDEPNSGLDIILSRELASLIAHIAKTTNRPAIVAVHHYQDLLPVVDRVLVINSQKGQIEEIAPDSALIESYLSLPERPSLDEDTQKTETGSATGTVLQGRARPRFIWLAKYFLHYFYMLLFASPVLIYMILSGLLTGFISTWFLFEHFPYREFLAPLVHDNTLESLGFVQFRILVPLLTALLLAARNSAMISADLGHRVYASQIDAMKNLSVPYWLYLIANVVITMILACLFYNAFNFLLCALSTLYTWKFIHPAESVVIWKTVYYREILNGIFPEGMGWVVGKMSLSGLAIGAVSTIFGLQRKSSVVDMNHGIAWSIIWATSLVLIIHAVFALLEI